jgi:ribosome-binding factor A
LDSIRKKKIESEILRTLSSLLVSGKVKDPRIGIVSLHKAELAPDMTQVKIWVTSYIEAKEKGKFLSAMKNAAGYFQKVIGEDLKLRFTPKIVFIWDENFEKSLQVNDLIDKLSTIAREKDKQEDEEQ